ncbi:heme biosynthesis protein HemY [Bartonella ancashensis]|nr:heme biosynthesis HemY N-terminal domain-containing protein [Bartonella ancashensis]
MMRIILYSVVVCLVSAVFGWVASYNGIVVITALQTRISFSLLTFFSLSIVFLITLIFLWWFLQSLFSAPKVLYNYFYARRQKKCREALSEGLLAVFAGDYVTAQKMEQRSLKYFSGEHDPLMKLLQAHTLFLQKDSARSISFYENMKKEESTRLAGLYGLFREAVSMNAHEVAQHYAEEALALSPALSWAQQAVLERLASEEQWDEALDVFYKAQEVLPYAAHFTEDRRHMHALLLSGRALRLLEKYPIEARKTILKAYKLQPDFIPIITITADILYKLSETKKADKIVFNAWKKDPHPDIGTLYVERERGAVGRLKNARKLASYCPDTFESAFLVAKAALDAGEVALAREQAQKALEIYPRENVYLLLADIEEAQGNNQIAARQWLSLAVYAQRDPVWMCEGVIFPSWSIVSPVSGKLGGFEWKAPPCRVPVTLEIDPVKPEKEDEITKVTFIDSESSNQSFPLDDSFVAENIAGQKQDNKIRLNVDDPGVQGEEVSPGAKENFK